MNTRQQIIIIHGGSTFLSEKKYMQYLRKMPVALKKDPYWDADIEKKLGKSFEVSRPRMPLRENAKYRDWEVGRWGSIPT